MVTVKEQLEMNFPGLFSRESEAAKKKRGNWDRFVYPVASDAKDRTLAEFMIYSPFEEVTGTLTDANGKLLPLYRLKVININGLSKETLMCGDTVVRSLVADIVNNGLLVDDGLTNMAGLTYSVDSILLKGEVPDRGDPTKMVRKTWHKFALLLDKSLPESDRNTAGVEAYIQQEEAERNTDKERKEKDKATVAQGSIETTEKKNADEMFGDKNKSENTVPQQG